jgi:eukaryotic-like serine/threonine-protein kinase
MPPPTSERLVELIHRSQLAQPEAIDRVLGRLRDPDTSQLPEDPLEITRALEAEGLITPWHSEKLLQGKYKGFFLGKHKLLGHLGTGGMSSVYLAEHLLMGNRRAIKVLPKTKLAKSTYLQRFRLEAKAIAALDHPNIVRAHDIDNQDDTHYIVMEYVDGQDLQSLVKQQGALPFELAANYIAQAARGLHHAHQAGLIHRDVKPANLLVSRRGEVKLLDLGLAMFTQPDQDAPQLDRPDRVLGTADYLPPEQARNSARIDYRADIYSLGCTLYFLLTGSPPFPSGSVSERIRMHKELEPEDIRRHRPDCPGELVGICVKMMQKDPAYRYADCRQVEQMLSRWLASYQRSEHPQPSFAKIGPAAAAPSPSGQAGDWGRLPPDWGTQRDIADEHDTLVGRSHPGASSSMLNLSPTDSQILANASGRSVADTGSHIDLERERGGRRPADASRPNGPKTSQRGADRPGSAPVDKPTLAQWLTPWLERLPNSRWTLVVALVGLMILFTLAVLLGVWIARSVSPEPPPSESLPAGLLLNPINYAPQPPAESPPASVRQQLEKLGDDLDQLQAQLGLGALAGAVERYQSSEKNAHRTGVAYSSAAAPASTSTTPKQPRRSAR